MGVSGRGGEGVSAASAPPYDTKHDARHDYVGMLDRWTRCTPGENSPDLSTIPRSLEYISQYAQDRAYIPQ
jgi:hypothetical protein